MTTRDEEAFSCYAKWQRKEQIDDLVGTHLREKAAFLKKAARALQRLPARSDTSLGLIPCAKNSHLIAQIAVEEYTSLADIGHALVPNEDRRR